jgi:hypothetical protein
LGWWNGLRPNRRWNPEAWYAAKQTALQRGSEVIKIDLKFQQLLRRCSGLGVLILCIAFGFTSESKQAPKDQVQPVFESLHRSIAKLSLNTRRLGFQGVEAETVERRLDSIESGVSLLEEIVRSQPNVRIPQEYTASLQLDAQLLANLTGLLTPDSASRSSVYAGLADVALDIDIKVTYARSALTAGLRLVQVVVHTTRVDKEVGGYQVWYVPKGWADVKDQAKPFDRLSSPTYMDLPPGNYLIWTLKGETKSTRQPISLGDDGRSRREIDLPIE